ncbi:MAG: hypothetical protein RLZZ350_549 [Verrucomicrobiota bacterium]|jgi:hypothetical protein
MIFNRDILFIHVPKTGGMAMTDLLLAALPKPVFYTHPHEHSPLLAAQGVVEITGDRHESLPEAREILAKRGFAMEQFRLILAVIRNPYALEVSRFCYLQNGNAVDRGHNQTLAMSGDFEKFAQESFDHGDGVRPIESYYQLDGALPKNLRVLRQENLTEDLRAAFASVGLPTDFTLPVVNETRHEPFATFFTLAAAAAVEARYHWFFDQGFYPRFDDATFNFATPGARFADSLKLIGPVQRLGPAKVCWRDTWVSDALRFPVRVTTPVRGLRLAIATPRHTTAPTDIVLKLSAREFCHSFPGQQDSVWEIPCPLAAHEAVEVELIGTPVFSPSELDKTSRDIRRLSFRLQSFEFQPA